MMKKVIVYFIFIIAGNILCINFAFVQDNFRFFALFGFLLIAYSIVFKFPFLVAEWLSGREFSYEIAVNSSKTDKHLNKSAIIWLATFIITIGLQAFVFISFFKSQNKLLEEKGIMQKTVVLDRKWEYKSKNKNAWHIHYEFEYNGKIYKHKTDNDFFEIGDTITIKFLPENPHNHKVMNIIKNKIE